MQDMDLSYARSVLATMDDKTRLYADMDQSKNYSKFRPTYSDELFTTVVEFCRETSPSLDLAVDVGCGPGMSTVGFSKYFKKVIGLDISESQVACCPKDVPNCEFRVSPAESLPFIESGTVDLFASGTAIHFMSLKETWAEADRILKPGGTIAIYTYDLLRAINPEIDSILQKTWRGFMPYFPKEVNSCFYKYEDLELPYTESIQRRDFKLPQRINLEEFMGIVQSMWPFVGKSRAHPEEDIAGDLRKEMTAVLAKVNPPGDTTFETWRNLFLVMVHKPSK